MDFAASTPSVRVPKVHDAWEVDDYTSKDGSVTTTYIVIEFVNDSVLADIWHDLAPEHLR
jgi:hypothetical protein